jgi:hypothetical protein
VKGFQTRPRLRLRLLDPFDYIFCKQRTLTVIALGVFGIQPIVVPKLTADLFFEFYFVGDWHDLNLD